MEEFFRKLAGLEDIYKRILIAQDVLFLPERMKGLMEGDDEKG